MYPSEVFVEKLYEFLTGSCTVRGNIIRKHSKKLEQIGDVSFPLSIKNWTQSVNKVETLENIFDYLFPDKVLKEQLNLLVKESKSWVFALDNYKVRDNDVHLYLERTGAIDLTVKLVLHESIDYGLKNKCFDNKINLVIDADNNTLSDLRVSIVHNAATNILNSLTKDLLKNECTISVTNKNSKNVIFCGAILNENGGKDMTNTPEQLYKKRSLDMQLMAQHKYGVQVNPTWSEYFQKLGKAAVVIEMLQSKTHKATKITLNSLQTSTKGPSFIFYNCARISSLLKQFEEHVKAGKYPELPAVDKVDFGLLNQPEEWEIVYVYIMQFPLMLRNCVESVKEGVINLHCLVFFLSNLSSIFSVYYRRIKILTSTKEHLLPVLYARIYLIKAVQQVFYTALRLLNIEPVKEM